ncbi:hypothetical protein BU24DRAFT_8813 [Aaosphaeria arxii CBS 175.79]|uniref:Uncharacterized protein n=1 Tax=Aaosphaeria arxii CBS 175.79 TaxID=1450172 RepID=A0A6A5Y5G7_9PLEO|nr:uncharacterized protein BU24DRAFT_8813 [Aaosphaeria arxii CBS 175.79]KAF2020802.1 hypothetical protein BU24DRAFT_8813 [Aaosphaeria arxii CBS 175.79]
MYVPFDLLIHPASFPKATGDLHAPYARLRPLRSRFAEACFPPPPPHCLLGKVI